MKPQEISCSMGEVGFSLLFWFGLFSSVDLSFILFLSFCGKFPGGIFAVFGEDDLYGGGGGGALGVQGGSGEVWALVPPWKCLPLRSPYSRSSSWCLPIVDTPFVPVMILRSFGHFSCLLFSELWDHVCAKQFTKGKKKSHLVFFSSASESGLSSSQFCWPLANDDFPSKQREGFWMCIKMHGRFPRHQMAGVTSQHFDELSVN